MGKIIIEVEENINLKIKAKNTKEGLKIKTKVLSLIENFKYADFRRSS